MSGGGMMQHSSTVNRRRLWAGVTWSHLLPSPSPLTSMEDPLQQLGCFLKKPYGMEVHQGSRLIRLALLAAALALVGRQRWWLVAIAYIAYRVSLTDFFQRCKKTILRDLTGLILLIKVKTDIKRRLRENRPLHKIFLEKVALHPNKEAAVEIETGKRMSYYELNQLMNRYANYFEAQGYGKGDVVSLFMENSIDFFALWLGLSKIGVVSAFINSNLKLEPLGHSIRVANSRCIITTESLLPILRQAISSGLVPSDSTIFLNSAEEDDQVTSLAKQMEGVSDEEPSDLEGLDFQSVLCYIYTSGTTGNPKPAVIKHFRYYWMAMGSGRAFGIVPDDRVYITMPIYHSAAGVLGIGSTIVQGTTVVIRKKFSASNFWKDALAHDCTCSQYIGELCRYLLAQKPTPEEKQHKIRTMWGNGLRGEIWREFTTRFNISRVGELYGSTEGNSNIVNLDNHVGSCGFFPIYPFITSLYPVRLIRIDEETGELIRDKNGLCVPCKPGETGEMIGLIKNKDILLRFEGYVDKGDTAKKIYKDVIHKGDQVFSSGDILHWDELGYLYFKDRRGDTFRWKGENVSTTEVESILQPVKSVIDCTVYGVEVGKQEGRAGMAAMNLSPDVDVQKFLDEAAERLSANLAGYAIPVFIRLCGEVEKTGTYKLRKTDLQKEGFNLEKCKGDPIFIYQAASKKYTPLNHELQLQIESGEYTRL